MDPTITFPLLGDWFAIDWPRYFTIFGFNVYYYALCIVLGYGLAALYLVKRRELFGLTTDNILDLLLIAVPCGIVGARIYYMLFNPNDFFGEGNWGNILNFRNGGLAVYGGIIASGLVFIIYSRKKKIPLGSLLDAASFGLFIGQAIGRWGNFINREAYGVETELPWKMGLTRFGTTTYHHPTFLYESIWNASGLLILHLFSKRFKTKYPGQYFLFYVAWYGLGRFMIEGLRTDSLYFPGTEQRVSQWLAGLSFLCAAGMLAYYQYYKTDAVPAIATAGKGKSDKGKAAKEKAVEEDAPEEKKKATKKPKAAKKPADDEIDEVDELAELDGADKDDVDYEDSDEPGGKDKDKEDIDELEELDGATEEDIIEEELQEDD